MGARIAVDYDKVAEFCRRHHIRKRAFFGSVLRDDFGPESEVDVLVEFEPGHVPGLRFFEMQVELSEILGCKVARNTPGFLSKHFRKRIEQEADIQYARP